MIEGPERALKEVLSPKYYMKRSQGPRSGPEPRIGSHDRRAQEPCLRIPIGPVPLLRRTLERIGRQLMRISYRCFLRPTAV